MISGYRAQNPSDRKTSFKDPKRASTIPSEDCFKAHWAPQHALAAPCPLPYSDQLLSQLAAKELDAKPTEAYYGGDRKSQLSPFAIQQLIDNACATRNAERKKEGGDQESDDRGEYVCTTPDGYIIYRLLNRPGYGVAGFPNIYRIKRTEPSESMYALQAGEGLCMCRAMGTCPLMAYTHPPPCDFCTDPMITRYYPSDSNWWDLRDKIKELRKLVRFDGTETGRVKPAVQPSQLPNGPQPESSPVPSPMLLSS